MSPHNFQRIETGIARRREETGPSRRCLKTLCLSDSVPASDTPLEEPRAAVLRGGRVELRDRRATDTALVRRCFVVGRDVSPLLRLPRRKGLERRRLVAVDRAARCLDGLLGDLFDRLHFDELGELCVRVQDEENVEEAHQRKHRAPAVHKRHAPRRQEDGHHPVAQNSEAEHPRVEHHSEGEGYLNLHTHQVPRNANVQRETVVLRQKCRSCCELQQKDHLVEFRQGREPRHVRWDTHPQAHTVVDPEDYQQTGRVLSLALRAAEGDLVGACHKVLQLPSHLAQRPVASEGRGHRAAHGKKNSHGRQDSADNVLGKNTNNQGRQVECLLIIIKLNKKDFLLHVLLQRRPLVAPRLRLDPHTHLPGDHRDCDGPECGLQHRQCDLRLQRRSASHEIRERRQRHRYCFFLLRGAGVSHQGAKKYRN
eukprot:Hpha_TRINITY_DN15118_c1_g3::TRINITY_DN15118_c1_g3_i1::g.127463::m.127463